MRIDLLDEIRDISGVAQAGEQEAPQLPAMGFLHSREELLLAGRWH